MWLFRGCSHRFVSLHDLGVLKDQLAGLSQSQLKAKYTTVIPEMDPIVDEIKRLGRTLPIAQKSKKPEVETQPKTKNR